MAVDPLSGYDRVPDDLLGDRTMTPAAARKHPRISAGHDAFDRLSAMLVLHGEADLMVPASNAFTLSQYVPGSSSRTFPQGRHGFFDELESTVGPLVADHLRGT
jgi:hypothetical protein